LEQKPIADLILVGSEHVQNTSVYL